MDFTNEKDFSTKTVVVDAPRDMVEALMRTASEFGHSVLGPLTNEGGPT